MNSNTLTKIKDCIIDCDGVFKYIQINCTDSATKENKIIVRGFNSCSYHPDIHDKFHSSLKYYN